MESRNEGKRNFENVAATWPPFFNISEGVFELSKENEKNVLRFVSCVKQRKNSESPNLRPSDSALRCLSTEPQRSLKAFKLLQYPIYKICFLLEQAFPTKLIVIRVEWEFFSYR